MDRGNGVRRGVVGAGGGVADGAGAIVGDGERGMGFLELAHEFIEAEVEDAVDFIEFQVDEADHGGFVFLHVGGAADDGEEGVEARFEGGDFARVEAGSRRRGWGSGW